MQQHAFIKQLGGDVRIEQLIENASAEAVESLKSGYDMLTHPDKMGARFKFLSMFPAVLRDHLTKYPVNGFQ